MSEKFQGELMDDIDACNFCPSCKLRREDCLCSFEEDEGVTGYPCNCSLCHCKLEVVDGGQCPDCRSGAHQG
jgi:hypothetical protein